MKKGILLALASLAASLLFCLGLTFGILALVFGTLKANPAYRNGLDLARHDPAVIQMFGSPIMDGFFVGGSIHTSEYCCGSASLETSLSGPKAHGSISIYGLQDESGGWYAEDVNIRIDGKVVLAYSRSEASQGFHKPLH